MPSPFTYYSKTPAQVTADGLRTLSNGLKQNSIPNPNVGPGSDYQAQWVAIGNEIGVAQANAVIKADGLMPDTATGSDLDRWLTLLGLGRNGAVGSEGVVTISLSTTNTFIASGQQLTDVAGLRYQVLVGGLYSNGAQVPVGAVDTGSATDHANGDILSWVTPPAYAAPTATVGTPGGTDGLTGGTDSEVGNDSPPRARLFAKLQNPPGGGNWSQIVGWGAASSTLVGLTSVYPALNGPATVYVCVSGRAQTTGVFTSASYSRTLLSSLVSTVVQPYIAGLLPESINCVVMSSVDSPTSVQLQLTIPNAPTASPPGPGGGWLDGTPWPNSLNNAGNGPTTVTSVTTSSQFTVNASTSPTVGVTHVSWLSPSNWTIYNAVVTSVSGTAGAYSITLSAPFPGIVNGSYIFPSAVNMQNYVNAVLSSFAAMGPGEWTTNTNVIPRAFRHPLPTVTAPYSLGGPMLQALERSGVEVQNAQFLNTSTGGTSQITPAVPSNLLTAPNILTPQNIGFYLS